MKLSRPRAAVVPSFDRLDGLPQRATQHALAAGPEKDAEQPSLDVLAVTDDDRVDVRGPSGLRVRV
jgi:hypothetical protein